MNYIPEIIHYCWFGEKPLGDMELACIESWRKFLPGYEIVRWDESNYNFRSCDYVSEAYDAGKWAFVSDYARFDILYRYGGLYFDTDVELIKPIDDIVVRGPFMGCETDWDGHGNTAMAPGMTMTVNPGVGLGARPGMELYRTIMDSYRGDSFCKPDGTLDQTTVVMRVTKILMDLGLELKPGIQEVGGVWIYPSEFFNPKDYVTGEINTTENTRSIHHFSMSWFTPEERYQHDVIGRLVSRGFSDKAAGRLSAIAATLKFRDFGRVVEHFDKGRQ